MKDNIQFFLSSVENYAESSNFQNFRNVFDYSVVEKNKKKWKIFINLKKHGFTLFSFDIVSLVLQSILEHENQILEKNLLNTLNKIVSNLELTKKNEFIEVIYKGQNFPINTKNKKNSKELLSSKIFCSFVEKIFRNFVSTNTHLIILLRQEKPFFRTPSICIYDIEGSYNKFESFFDQVKKEVSLGDIKRVINSFEEIIETRNHIDSTKLKFLHTENINDFIREYSLMQHIKKYVKHKIKLFLKNKPRNSCDVLDLEYQVLFRVTSFSISEIFPEALELIKFTEDIKNENIFDLYKIPKDFFVTQKINNRLLENIIIEQYKIIIDRLQKSKLPIKKLLNFNPFKKKLIIRNNSGKLFLQGKNIKYDVLFKEVDKEMAIAFHNDLHYIHTPRCEIALGFFIKGSKIPFSILTSTKIDRQYKSDALIAFGFDPRNCFDFTRLYSLPNAPKNLSSCIFKEAFDYLREKFPRFQAALSAFMPSYASGNSMLTGGFNHPIIFKQGRHFFQRKKVKNEYLYEHVTKRRFNQNIDNYIESVFPLLPVVELIAVNSKPLFEPLLKLGKDALLIKK